MKSTEYSEKVLDHFRHPRNVGTLEGENIATGKVGNPVCGDIMQMFIDVEKDPSGKEIIQDIKFQTFGCGSAIATSSMITEMVKGKSIEDALKVTRKDVADELDGLPPIKMHCSNLASDALHAAIRNYQIAHGNPEKGDKKISEGMGEVKGLTEFEGKGLNYEVGDYSQYKDKRTIILYSGEKSVDLALTLTQYTNRVVLATQEETIETTPEKKKELQEKSVKTITHAVLVEVQGEGTLDKVLFHDLEDGDEFAMFVDKMLLLKDDTACKIT